MKRDEFKARWESPNCDITFEEVAECAKEWGLFSRPKCCSIHQVLYRVLIEAGCSDAEEYNPSPTQKFIVEITRPREDAKVTVEELYEIIGTGLHCCGWDIDIKEE